MKTTAIALGVVCALTAGHALGQTKPAYVVAQFNQITDPAGLKKFSEATETLVRSYGAEYLSRGNKPVAAAGEVPPYAVILKFESLAKAQAYYQSAEYKALIPNRDKSLAKFRSFILEGGDVPQKP